MDFMRECLMGTIGLYTKGYTESKEVLKNIENRACSGCGKQILLF